MNCNELNSRQVYVGLKRRWSLEVSIQITSSELIPLLKKNPKVSIFETTRGPLISAPYTEFASTGHLHSSNLET